MTGLLTGMFVLMVVDVVVGVTVGLWALVRMAKQDAARASERQEDSMTPAEYEVVLADLEKLLVNTPELERDRLIGFLWEERRKAELQGRREGRAR